MLRRNLLCLATAGAAQAGPFLNPYRVLDLDPSTPFEDVKRQFHKLTQVYHPDKQTGDDVKFREINAAYRQIRTDYRNRQFRSDTGSSRTSTAYESSGEFWEERNRQVREEADRRRKAEQKSRENVSRTEPKRGYMAELLYAFNGYEIAISLFSVVVVLMYSLQRYYVVRKLVNEKNVHLKNMDEGLPPPMPLELDDALVQRYSTPPERTSLEMDAERIRRESSYRMATQRRFEDFREYMFVYDPDSVAHRKVTTTRFSFQYLNEKDIVKQCPIIREFDSEVRGKQYDSIEKELAATLTNTLWESPDTGYATALVAQGLQFIPVNSPSTTKWTLIEYMDTSKGKKKETPMCVAAIRNTRFETIGMCQRITVTGKPDLRPELKAQREKALAGKRRVKYVKGGVSPIKDLSIPLQQLQL